MTRKNFFTILLVFSVVFVFVKIYQHNLLIKVSYTKQRLEKQKSSLKKEKSILLAELFRLKKLSRVKSIAQSDLGMKHLKLSEIVTFTSCC